MLNHFPRDFKFNFPYWILTTLTHPSLWILTTLNSLQSACKPLFPPPTTTRVNPLRKAKCKALGIEKPKENPFTVSKDSSSSWSMDSIWTLNNFVANSLSQYLNLSSPIVTHLDYPRDPTIPKCIIPP